MVQDYSSHAEMQTPNFRGDHPEVVMSVVLASGSSEAELAAGTVLAKITASGKHTPWVHDAEDGSETPCAILAETITVPASGDEAGMAYVHGEFLRSGLTWDSTAETADVNTAVATLLGKAIFVK